MIRDARPLSFEELYRRPSDMILLGKKMEYIFFKQKFEICLYPNSETRLAFCWMYFVQRWVCCLKGFFSSSFLYDLYSCYRFFSGRGRTCRGDSQMQWPEMWANEFCVYVSVLSFRLSLKIEENPESGDGRGFPGKNPLWGGLKLNILEPQRGRSRSSSRSWFFPGFWTWSWRSTYFSRSVNGCCESEFPDPRGLWCRGFFFFFFKPW